MIDINFELTGNTCDDANDAVGCIFSQNLLVADVTEDQINVAVASAGLSVSPSASAQE